MIEVWISMALATTIMSWWLLYRPIFEKLGESHTIRANPTTSIILWSLGTTVFAPIVIPALMIDSYRDAFINGFIDGSEED